MSEENKVGKFTLVNPDKITRVLEGAQNEHGEFFGGIRESDGSFDKTALLVGYDKIGGLIKKDDDKVRTGSFYDFGKRKAREIPKVEFEFRINGEVVYVPEEAEKPNAIKAVQMVEKEHMKKRLAN